MTFALNDQALATIIAVQDDFAEFIEQLNINSDSISHNGVRPGELSFLQIAGLYFDRQQDPFFSKNLPLQKPSYDQSTGKAVEKSEAINCFADRMRDIISSDSALILRLNAGTVSRNQLIDALAADYEEEKASPPCATRSQTLNSALSLTMTVALTGIQLMMDPGKTVYEAIKALREPEEAGKQLDHYL